ncbi:Small RNA degrading nuclease 1 [Monoraphidium neglectum]|uniref:Small RNA degrading nuclease 1 n=1 Tax=Monoraphidium neglectum TaxID=145388 RepID=A0A0D2MTD8_9CHLO|nr:Small RNA degrading nuclease 1 [Monoraphidium neglectum]KIZ03702.1 Small RNA degrading nuclease 1 [Monoraphidium neglectum]|eukprot:XP_013902721.1 Small RNA degrading nuclease 1 [Monoraphidium neglectum]
MAPTAVSWLKASDAAALADCVKHTQQAGLKGPGGQEWKAFVQALPAAQRHQDPSRHEKKQLLAFLSGVAAEPEQARQLKRYVKWRAAVQEEAAAARAGTGGAAEQQGEPAAAALSGDGRASSAAWRLVARTRAHPKFQRCYSFPSWEKGWIRTSRLRPDGAEAAAAPLLLGLDCEMCATSKSSNALLSLAVVDQSGAVLLRELVKPEGKVVDLRTAITGITKDDLTGVTARRSDAAARLAAMLGPDTILVGHSLSADLAALKLDHQPVIDTALLYSYKGLSQATPSLVHLAQQLLGRKLRAGNSGDGDDGGDGDGRQDGGGRSSGGAASRKRQHAEGGGTPADAAAAVAAAGEGVHDSREDAAAAMALVAHEMAKEAAGEATAPLDPPAVKAPKSDLVKLLVHSIPASLASPQLPIIHALGKAGAPPPAAVEAGSGPGQLLLVFSNAAVAEAAFSALPGPRGADSVGRPQKELQLAGGFRVRVRKMACHAGAAFGKDAPKDRGQPKTRKRKLKKRAGGGAAAEPAAAAGGGGAEGRSKRRRKGEGEGEGMAAASAAAADGEVTPGAETGKKRRRKKGGSDAGGGGGGTVQEVQGTAQAGEIPGGPLTHAE